jgi:hypothetical protein
MYDTRLPKSVTLKNYIPAPDTDKGGDQSKHRYR